MQKTFKGIGVSPGIVIGKAHLLNREIEAIPKYYIGEDEKEKEIKRFQEAINLSISQLKSIKERFSEAIGQEHVYIFEAKILMLQDEMIYKKVTEKITTEKMNTEWALTESIGELIKIFSGFDDEYLKERRTDVSNLGKRILANLMGFEHESISDLKEEAIVIAHDIAPSDTAQMHKEKVIAFATDIGGKTSHTAIMARCLEIPAVVGLEDVTSYIKTGDRIIVDGNSGEVLVNPDEETYKIYLNKQLEYNSLQKNLYKLKDLPAETADGYRVNLTANIELSKEIDAVLDHGADGIGLYRTEFLFLNRKTLPSEEEQFENYKTVAKKIYPLPAVLRTLDLGGDKFLSHLDYPEEMNPAMGLRAIRFCLDQPWIFRTQLRAILRASVYGNLKIMYPMISGIKELTLANAILEECKEELRKEEKPFNEQIPVGIMIEVPTAALTADILAKEVNFFSIGTNDLIQYSLAIDRVNEKVAYLYDPLHPAILRLIRNIVTAAKKEKIPVGLCGEMGGDPLYSLILVGLGINELSMNPGSILNIKKLIRSITLEEAKKVADHVLSLDTSKEIENYLNEEIKIKLYNKVILN
ncbi:MAG: phosphoenolpyruvate--protein phosphotransferase [Candidatus Schekmanbacteria bacterium RBG_16_38_11]|uniref:Phosphoenolpyruvate-protein phosphotransferase n=1 Tax=Candidatus Schekmanbacteria bacterium RBG_16_38_11 TaxID=1817880 RepID=A0A1F7RTZ4_9BACT|nr:MAG: phosphoenolpyruvate--protein phosphotransferase [Candidatus Schekmanbacteria bacterium RBG_16_38_11]